MKKKTSRTFWIQGCCSMDLVIGKTKRHVLSGNALVVCNESLVKMFFPKWRMSNHGKIKKVELVRVK